MFTIIGLNGGLALYPANPRPDYLPDRSEEWPRLRTGCLVLDSTTRHWLESADWTVEGIRFSQVGGHRTWVQVAEYSRCPECGRAMTSSPGFPTRTLKTTARGSTTCPLCPECGVAATDYQQS